MCIEASQVLPTELHQHLPRAPGIPDFLQLIRLYDWTISSAKFDPGTTCSISYCCRFPLAFTGSIFVA